MRKILILGAGVYQVPLIQKAKELGLYTIVTSIKGNYPGFAMADKVYFVNTTDKDACLRIAKEESIDAVCTTGTDVALPTMGYINDKLGLCGPSEYSAIVSSNKLLMKQSLEQSGVQTALFGKVMSYQDCVEIAESIGYPCVLKVVDSSGSRGIQIVQNASSLEQAYNKILPFTKQNYVIVEKFLNGLEFGAQAMVYKGKILFVMPHGDEVFSGATGVPIGHYVPYINNDKDFFAHVQSEVAKSIVALKIDNAAVNVDLIMVDGQPYILELGARCGATGLADLVSIYYGIDYYQMIINVALGQLFVKENQFIPKKSACVKLITSTKNGILKDYNEKICHNQLEKYCMDYHKGDVVNKFKIGPDRVGEIIVSGALEENIQKIAEDLLAQVNLVVE